MWSGTERGSMNKKDLEKYKKSLPPEVLKDMQIGGKTQSPMSDLAILGAAAAEVKGLPALAANEVAKMTISDAAFKKGLLPQLTKGGIKNWQHLRPWNSFLPKTPLTPGGTLQTLPTPAAGAALGLMIEGAGAPPAIAGIPPGGWQIGGKKKTGMGSLTPEAVEDLIKNNPGAAEKIRKLYKEQQGGTELFPGV